MRVWVDGLRLSEETNELILIEYDCGYTVNDSFGGGPCDFFEKYLKIAVNEKYIVMYDIINCITLQYNILFFGGHLSFARKFWSSKETSYYFEKL